jgi:hypothetical protein
VSESRRRFLKGAAVGAGVVWTTPTLSRVGLTGDRGSPAPTTTTSAPSTDLCSDATALCPDVMFRFCGTRGSNFRCICVETPEGPNACVDLTDSSPIDCSSSDQCLVDEVCALTQCDDPADAPGQCLRLSDLGFCFG